jgi:hypothetical protein
VFGAQETARPDRAHDWHRARSAKIGLQNLAYNIRRLMTPERSPPHEGGVRSKRLENGGWRAKGSRAATNKEGFSMRNSRSASLQWEGSNPAIRSTRFVVQLVASLPRPQRSV